MAFRFYDPETLPARFDIVYCWFPYRESRTKRAPKPRPGLVFDSAIDEDGLPYVWVHYGTSQNFDHLNPFQFVVGNSADIERAGLTYMTRFDLRPPELLPWAEEFVIERHRGQGLIMGRLPPRQIEALNKQSAILRHKLLEFAKIVEMQNAQVHAEKKPGQVAKQNPRKPRRLRKSAIDPSDE